jgi:hypothetical protein
MYLHSFVAEKLQSSDPDLVTISKFCTKAITKLCKVGPKGRTLTIPEIDRAWVF